MRWQLVKSAAQTGIHLSGWTCRAEKNQLTPEAAQLTMYVWAAETEVMSYLYFQFSIFIFSLQAESLSRLKLSLDSTIDYCLSDRRKTALTAETMFLLEECDVGQEIIKLSVCPGGDVCHSWVFIHPRRALMSGSNSFSHHLDKHLYK